MLYVNVVQFLVDDNLTKAFHLGREGRGTRGNDQRSGPGYYPCCIFTLYESVFVSVIVSLFVSIFKIGKLPIPRSIIL